VDQFVVPSVIPSVVHDVATLASITPARERTVPVEPALSQLFPEAGLQRGHVIGCRGVAARTAALALTARAVTEGAWLAVVGLDDLGVEAATELGIPAERVVAIAAATPREWAERTAAAADGFELIITTLPTGAERGLRKVRQRLQARGSVLIVVPPATTTVRNVRPGSGAGGFGFDVATSHGEWLGIGEGHGRLVARRVGVRSSGRRIPRPVTIDCWLPGPDGRVDIVQTGQVTLVEDDVVDDTVSRAS